MTARNLDNLFHEILKDLYYAKKRLLRILPAMAGGATSPALAALFVRHGHEAQTQISRLEKVFEMLGEPPRDRTWPVIGGMIDEGLDFLQQYKSSPALDAGLLAVAQAVGHYEMARHDTLKRWAEVLDMKQAANLLDESLQEDTRYSGWLVIVADRVLKAETMKETLAIDVPPLAVLSREAA